MAPLVASGHDVEGVVIWGGGAKTWLERTLGFERRYREGTQVPADRLTREMKAISEFLPEYLIERRSPRLIAETDAELAKTWTILVGTEDESHYGRPLAFHHEAQARDWGPPWRCPLWFSTASTTGSRTKRDTDSSSTW